MTYCTLSEGEGKQQSFICCCIFSTYAWTPYHCVMIKLVGSVTTHPGESEVWMTKLWSGISSCSRRGHVYSLFPHTDTADMPRCSSSLQVEIDNIKNAQGCYLIEVGCHRASFIHKSSVWGLTDWRVPHQGLMLWFLFKIKVNESGFIMICTPILQFPDCCLKIYTLLIALTPPMGSSSL